MKTIIYSLLLVIVVSCSKSSDKIYVVTADDIEVLLKQDKVQLVDVRTDTEFNNGSIKNAQNIDFLSETFEDDIKLLDKTKPVIVFCQKGGRSAKCADRMIELGFEKIYDLEGGYSKWLSE